MNAQQDCTSFFLITVKRYKWRACASLCSMRLQTNVLCYFSEGSATIKINGEEVEIKSGTSLLLAPDMKIEGLVSEAGPMQLDRFFLKHTGNLLHRKGATMSMEKSEESLYTLN